MSLARPWLRARPAWRLAPGLGRIGLPASGLAAALLLWDRAVVWGEVPPYVLPRPGLVARTLVEDWGVLGPALVATAGVAMMALALAVAAGGAIAVLFAQVRWVETAFYPVAVVLQVTPVIAVAPLVFIWSPSLTVGLLICAWLVAFFPVLSATTLGLRSADRGLHDLMTLYGASRGQRLRLLEAPAALPYFLGGLRIAGGLSLIGAVVAEIAAGRTGLGAGLAVRIFEAGYRLDVPRMFAALSLVALLGVAIFAATSLVAHLALRRWHESAERRR